ncbi:MAG: protein phosphatase, partial [Lancefieldella parvula]|nr:protein phosphatase [Lancefieldella parvula]
NMSSLVETTSIEIKDLPDAVQDSLAEGIRVKNEDEAHSTVENYRKQIDDANTKAVKKKEDVQSGGTPTTETTTSTTSSGGE